MFFKILWENYEGQIPLVRRLLPKYCLVTALALGVDGSEGHCPESKAWWEGLNGEHSLFITCRVFHLSYPGSPPWVGKIPWRRAWQPTSVFLPGESHGQRNLAGCNLVGLWRVGHDWEAKHSTAQCFPKPHVLLFITKAEIHMPHLCSPWQWKQIIYLTWFNKGLYLVRSQRKLLINWIGSIKDLCSIVQLSTKEYSFIKHVLIHWLYRKRKWHIYMKVY